jgi:hypothetical protein
MLKVVGMRLTRLRHLYPFGCVQGLGCDERIGRFGHERTPQLPGLLASQPDRWTRRTCLQYANISVTHAPSFDVTTTHLVRLATP